MGRSVACKSPRPSNMGIEGRESMCTRTMCTRRREKYWHAAAERDARRREDAKVDSNARQVVEVDRRWVGLCWRGGVKWRETGVKWIRLKTGLKARPKGLVVLVAGLVARSLRSGAVLDLTQERQVGRGGLAGAAETGVDLGKSSERRASSVKRRALSAVECQVSIVMARRGSS